MTTELPPNYSFNLGEREERITARRSRIAARLAAEREGNGAGGAVEVEQAKQAGKGQVQVAESRKRLSKLKLGGDELVTGVRVTADVRESERLVQEAARRAELREALLQEAEAAAHANAAVAMKWPDISRLQVAQDLYMEVEAQRDACMHIMAGKEALIGELRAELKLKDDDYVKSLKRQAEEVETLLTHMGVQYRELQSACREELEEAEAAFLAERADLLEAHKAEMGALFERRNAAESAFMEAQAARRDEFMAALEALRVADAEDYNILKIRLETDIANLEQHLEAMRATYQLNTEKLEYNYRVLVERDHENQSTINQQKRKIARQRDILSSLKTKYAETDKKFQEDNLHLTEEYKRVTEQFKDLQAKFVHFEASDSKRYREVWAMNNESAQRLVARVLEADRVLHEQQLGLGWIGPDPALLAPPEPEEETQSAAALAAEGAAAAGGTAAEQLSARLSDPRHAKLLQLLCDEAGFLADSKAREVIEGAKRHHAATSGGPNGDTMMVGSILEALGVTDGPSFNALLVALSTDGGGRGGSGAPGSMSKLVSSDEAMRRLKAFVDAEQSALGSIGKSLRLTAPSEARRKVDKDRVYWERLSGVISPRMFRVWKALEKGLVRYLLLLQGRQELLADTAALQRQNAELRGLLNQYLASKINQELRVPPTQML